MSVECIGYKKFESGALQGFANFRVPKMGIEIFGCGIFSKNGGRWVSFPSREYQDKETGDKKFIANMRFIEKEHGEAFIKAALKALDEWCTHNVTRDDPQQESNYSSESIPF